MPLPTFNSTKHHIGLGPSGGTQLGFLIEGGYQRNAQRFGTPPEFGGERDQIAPSVLSRWTQDDFSGGVYQEFWGQDAAMFWRSENLLPSLLERSVRSVPPLVYWGAPGRIDASFAIAVFTSGGKVQVVEPNSTRHYDVSTGAVTSTSTVSQPVAVAAHDPNDNYIYAITMDGSNRRLRRYKDGVSPVTIDTFPAGAGLNVWGLEMAGKDLIASMGGNSLWLVDVADDRSDATFTRLGRLPGQWRDSIPYNGLVYILCTDQEQRTALFAWDGSSILPVVEWPYNFIGKCLTVYGGRLFVGGSGRDVSGTDKYAELYEITGSSLRLVRSFADEARGGRTVPTVVNDMAVHEGLLYLATDRHYLIAYDLTRDALFGGPNIVPDPSANSVNTLFLISTNQKLFAWCDDEAGSGGSSADGFYRGMSVWGDATDPTNNAPAGEEGTDITSYDAVLETSDFGPEPDRSKRWSTLRVLTRLSVSGAAGCDAEYSVDGGATFTALSGTDTTNGAFTVSEFDLGAVPVSKTIRFRLTATKTTLNYTEFIAFTTSFLMLDEDRRTWSLVVNGTDQPELLDHAAYTQDVAELDETLFEWWADKTSLDFTDLNGETRRVIITDIGDTKPVVSRTLDDGSREGFYSLVLTEF